MSTDRRPLSMSKRTLLAVFMCASMYLGLTASANATGGDLMLRIGTCGTPVLHGTYLDGRPGSDVGELYGVNSGMRDYSFYCNASKWASSSGRNALIDGCGRAYAGHMYGMVAQTQCGGTTDVAVSPKRFAIIDSCGASWVKEAPSLQSDFAGPWLMQTGCGDTQEISVTDNRIAIVNGCGAAFAKSGALSSAWLQLTSCNGADDIALTTNRFGLIDNCGASWVKEGSFSSPWAFQTGCGDTRALAVSNNRIALINGCGAAFTKDLGLSSPWGQQTQCGGTKTISISNNWFAITDSCNAVFGKEGSLSSAWVLVNGCSPYPQKDAVVSKYAYEDQNGDVAYQAAYSPQ